ncbi:MAG: aspartyl/glutamyl-tRNA amidotransferase subunit C [Clostridia bacterium]|nr:aspartyl/glutamyl-tRNA amidotransferase subunit C [Clostridia bacterium]
MNISIEEMRLLAQLSRLALTDDELKKFAGDLCALEEFSSALLPFFGPVSDTDEPQGLAQMREDIVRAGLDREELLALSRLRENGYIAVPCKVREV